MTERRWRALPSVTARRYALLQVPAALALAVVLLSAVSRGWTTEQTAFTILALWIVKDVLLYPLLRRAYEGSDEIEAARWRGRVGRAEEDLTPCGFVLVAGERWRAEAVGGEPFIRAGERVRVEAIDGLRLTVRRAQGDEIVRST